ncbi:Transcriptional regulator, contains XRE-family HTH domain [Faunimonas pinastri]|uniref:Transcriptional regulator, contains XRE-family HTH domain n=1 Tax=Faunimonas pinastri TaxID=1855383 RepID=A0A1H9D8Q1_9HYPH|nr:helix-turn-helix transcriptional regulator [Faunimonas pinastri]SEQ09856.1 Transcriptional regulator, contains XRE-family HTH domain [Faunimonas pinastri]
MARQPNSVDAYVGSRIRARRRVLDLTQEAIGDKVGVTFQQIQKYETGTNRVGASRLAQLAQVMDVPISYFFPDAEEGAAAEALDALPADDMASLCRAFSSIDDPSLRREILSFVETLSASRQSQDSGR